MLRAGGSTEVQRQEIRASTNLQSQEDAPLQALDVAAAIGLALSRCGMSNKEACAVMGVDQSLWTKQLHGDGHVSLQRLMKLPAKFWNEFLPLLGDPLQICVSSADIADLTMLRIVALMEEIGSYTLRLRSLRRSA
jgi:hypothetical protein